MGGGQGDRDRQRQRKRVKANQLSIGRAKQLFTLVIDRRGLNFVK